MIRFGKLYNEIDFRHAPTFVMCLLCIYFIYHLTQGERSIWSYASNKVVIEEKQAELTQLKNDLSYFERDIQKLRVSSLDLDFLEERARHILGYISKDEIILLR